MKVKLFSKANVKKDGSSLLDLENEINAWLEAHPNIEVFDMLQSSNRGSWMVSKIFITVWYTEVS
jgi:hypothetical protein